MIVDLFAGPGGWSEAIREHGLGEEVGIEVDGAACATRTAAGHTTIEADVAALDPRGFDGAVGLIASPPCQTFSAAGSRTGSAVLEQLAEAVHRGDWQHRPHPDPRVWLILEPGRWAAALRPEWIALEQVPGALSVWHAYADRWRADGWHTWAGIVNAADYGVPQTRRRAVLLAHRRRAVHRPPATHARDGAHGLLPWRTMAEALELGPQPAGEPAWPWERPATTVMADARLWPPGHKVNAVDIARLGEQAARARFGNRAGTGARRLTVTEALVLQGFPAGYPIRGRPAPAHVQLTLDAFPPDPDPEGTRSKMFEQIGNAVPPPLAAALLRQIAA